MKYISYALFNDCKPYEWNYYLRGVYFNVRMNKLLYPTWKTHITIQDTVWHEHYKYFLALKEVCDFDYKIVKTDGIQRCKAMLWRLDTLFEQPYVERILCRDLDAITTYRESLAVNEWERSGRVAHGINDNPAHSIALMGGMCGFTKELVNIVGVSEWNNHKDSMSLKTHGTDQDLLMRFIYPKVENSIMITKNPLQVRDNALWESDLVCSFIGSAGCNEMELVRFFSRQDDDCKKFTKFEKEFDKIMYWHL